MAVSASDLTKLYLAYFGRPPDFDGLQFYTSPANANLTIAQVAAGFSASAESQALYGSTSLSGVINNIYMNIFGRAADVSGLQFWSDAINSGKVTTALAAYNILTGALLLNNADGAVVLNKLAVSTAWDQALDTPAEIVGYTGATAASTARAFLASVTGTPASLAAHSGAALDAAINAAINAQGQITASVSSPQITEGNSGTKTMAFTISLDHAPTVPLTLNYTTSGGTATANDDYTTAAGAITFAAGQTVATVNVTVLGDTVFEADETVNLVVSGPLANPGGTAIGTGTILNDDLNPTSAVYTMAVAAAPVTEPQVGGTSTMTFVLTLNKAALAPVSFNYATGGGTAIAGTDYQAGAGVVTFAAGQTQATVTVLINNDKVVDANETITLNVSGTQLSAAASGSGTIVENNPAPVLTKDLDRITVVGSGPNTITGLVDGQPPILSSGTYTAGDQIVGNGQTTLALTVIGGGQGPFATVSGVKMIDLTAGTAGTTFTLNAGGFTGVGQIALDKGVDGLDVFVKNLAEDTMITVANVTGSISGTYNVGGGSTLFMRGVNALNGGTGFSGVVDANENVAIVLGNSAKAFVTATQAMALGNVAVAGADLNTFHMDINDKGAGANVSVKNVTVSLGKTSTASFTIDNGKTITIGDVALGAGINSKAVFDVEGGTTVSVNSVALNVGNGSTAKVTAQNVGGAVTITNGVSILAGTSSTGNVTIKNNAGAVTVGPVSVAAAAAQAYVGLNKGIVTVGDVNLVSTKGSASFSASSNGKSVSVSKISETATTSVNAQITGNGGDITVTKGISLVGGTTATVNVANNTTAKNITVGDVNLSAKTIAANFSTAANISLGNVTFNVADAGTLNFTVNKDANAKVGNITGTVGAKVGTAHVLISATGVAGDAGDVTVGNVNIAGAGKASSSISFSVDNWFNGTKNAGNITAGASNSEVLGDNSQEHFYLFNGSSNATTAGNANKIAVGNISVGDVSLTLGNRTKLAATLTASVSIDNSASAAGAKAGNVTAGNITVAVGNGFVSGANVGAAVGNVHVYNYAKAGDGNTTVGNIGLKGGQFSTLSASVSSTVSTKGSMGNFKVGNVAMAGGEHLLGTVHLEQANNAAKDAHAGSMTVGDVTITGQQDSRGTVSITQSVTAATAAKMNTVGDMSVGNISVTLGAGIVDPLNTKVGTIANITVNEQSAFGSATGAKGGNVTIGNISAAVSQTAAANLKHSAQAHVKVNVTQTGLAKTGTGGNVTIGNVALLGAKSASLDARVNVKGTYASMGNVKVGNVSLTAGDKSAHVQGQVYVSDNSIGKMGNVQVGDLTLSVGKTSTATVDVTVDHKGFAGGGMGTLTIGNISATGLDKSKLTVAATALGFSTSKASVGNVSIGTLTASVGKTGSLTATALGVSVSGANSSIGNVTVGKATVTAADKAATVHIKPLFSATAGSIGTVSIGGISATLGKTAHLTYSAGFYGKTGVGAVTVGDLSVTASDNALVKSLWVSASGASVGAVQAGNVSVNLGAGAKFTAANTQYGVFAHAMAGNVGGVTAGNLTVSLDKNSAGAFMYSDKATGFSAGAMKVGDVNITALDNGAKFVVSATNHGDNNDTITIGNIKASFAGTTDVADITVHQFNGAAVTIGNVSVNTNGAGDELGISLQTSGAVTIGDLTVKGSGPVNYDGALHAGKSYIDVATVAPSSVTIGNVDFSGVTGNATINMAWTTAGAANITGGTGNDTITGNAAANVITGGAGLDIMAGGAGKDTFVFAKGDSGTASQAAVDQITDFTVDGGTALTVNDMLKFGAAAGGAGTAGNFYAETAVTFDETTAPGWNSFLARADFFLNSTVKYFVESDTHGHTYVAVNYGSGGADLVVELTGVAAAASIHYFDIVG